MNIEDIKGYKWAQDVVNGNFIANKYVILECKKYINRLETLQYQDDFLYYFDITMCDKIYKLLKCMNYATGFYTNKPIYNHAAGFQFMVWENIFCWLSKSLDDFGNKQRMIEEVYLQLGRKSGKSFLAAVTEILIMLLSPQYAQHATAGKTREISNLVKQAIIEILKSSPIVNKHFKITREKIECKLNNCTQKSLSGEANNINGLLLQSFIIDEVGNQETQDIIGALKLSQMSTVNRLSIYISTAYNLPINAFKELCDYYKTVLDGVIDDCHSFGLIFELDKDDDYKDKNNWIKSSPLQMTIQNGISFLESEYNKAVNIPSKMTEFQVKILNMWLDGNIQDKYIDINYWKKCRVDKIDFKNKHVIVGVDLSITTDLTAVAIGYVENDIFYYISTGFLPRGSLSKRQEKIDYLTMERQGYCIINDGETVDYNIIEEYIRNIENKYECIIDCIVTDPYNALNMMQNLANNYDVLFLKQTYTNLSPATKDFRKQVYDNKIRYQANSLLDWNVSNAITTKGKSDDEMLAKQSKNKQRIDMLAVLIFIHTQIFIKEQEKYNPLMALDNANW